MDSPKEQISVKDMAMMINTIIRFFYKRIIWLVLAIILGGVLGLLFHGIQKPKFIASSTFILEEKSVGGGGLAGLASQFGFDMGSLSGGGSIFAGDNIIDIIRSKTIISKVLLRKLDPQMGMPNETLADFFLDFNGWKKKWTKLDSQTIRLNSTASIAQPKNDSVLNAIHAFLVKKSISVERINKKGSILRVQVTSSNSLFSRLLTEGLIDESAKMYLEVKIGTSQANINRMQARADSLLSLLNSKTYTVASTQLLDINPGLKSAAVPTEIATRDKTIISTLYAELTKNVEISRAMLSQQTPVIQILDKPDLILENEKKGRLFLIVVGGFVGAALMIAFFSVQHLLRILKKTVKVTSDSQISKEGK